MDVLETAKYFYAIGRFATKPPISFSEAWIKDVLNRPTIHVLHLLGCVSKLICTLITSHKGDLDDKGYHLSVSGYLTVCSTHLGHDMYSTL